MIRSGWSPSSLGFLVLHAPSGVLLVAISICRRPGGAAVTGGAGETLIASRHGLVPICDVSILLATIRARYHVKRRCPTPSARRIIGQQWADSF